MLNYEIENTGETLNIQISGDLDIYSSDDFKNDIKDQLDPGVKNLNIEADELEYIDSNGLGVLMAIYNAIDAEDKTVKISGLKSNVKKIFLITDLDQVFDLED